MTDAKDESIRKLGHALRRERAVSQSERRLRRAAEDMLEDQDEFNSARNALRIKVVALSAENAQLRATLDRRQSALDALRARMSSRAGDERAQQK